MRRSIPLWTAVLATTWAAAANAQTDIDVPRNYALTNARVVVAPGRVLERATVVVRNGRIDAVGDRVQVPAGVITMDVSGMTVYPGLVDVASRLGLPAIQTGGGRRGGGGGDDAARGGGPPPEVNPGRAAVDVFSPADDDIAALRAAGVTTLGLAFDGGIFPGRVSAVSVRADDSGKLVLRSPVAQQIVLGRKRGAYPSTLMGALAYIEQSFADARWDAQAAAAFERNPAATQRPEYDPEHRELQPAAAGSMPVWINASTMADVKRVIQLAQNIGVTNYVIVGAQEGYLVADQLKATGRPVIVGLDYPNVNQVTGRSYDLHVAPISGDDSVKIRADSATARTLRGNAAALAAAGVPFAMASAGVTPAQFRERVIATVEAGLAPDDALRALTVTPAGLLGLGTVLGTVEAGRLANLLVVQGDLFAKEGRIRWVFVEGERHEVVERPAAQGQRGGRGGGAAAAAGAAVATGDWTGTIDAQGNQMALTLTITAEGSGISALLGTDMGSTRLLGEQSGPDITLRGTFSTPDGEIALTVSARITGNDMQGTVGAGDMGNFPFTARRRGPGGSGTFGFSGGIR